MIRNTAQGTPRIRSVVAVAGLAGLVVLAACISSPVTVDASDGRVLSRAATVHVALLRDSEIGTVSPETEALLRSGTEDTLRAKGYAIGSAAESDLILELTPRTESVSRRTWSSDPDASAARTVRRPEAVLSLRARSGGDNAEVWICEARARLPETGRSFATSASEVWIQVLAKALERVPGRS